jgi:hypothetical protein
MSTLKTGNITHPSSTSTAISLDASDNVGVGTASPDQKLTVASEGRLRLYRSDNTRYGDIYTDNSFLNIETSTDPIKFDGQGYIRFDTNSSEAARLTSAGDLLVGKTASTGTTAGGEIRSNGFGLFTRDGGNPLQVRRLTDDGNLIEFLKDASYVGKIGNATTALYITNGTSTGIKFGTNAFYATNGDGTNVDNSKDVGTSGVRFDNVYATNGTIQTSDANEKQDIEELSEAEKRVATAAKGLIRKFRWIDSVDEKGDDARIHVGVIAQDLQAAFEAEGLDAGRYAMFISSTWWEATETYTDDDGVEQTRVNTYDTSEEAPEGAIERTRLGVRYPELLAFIIGAL